MECSISFRVNLRATTRSTDIWPIDGAAANIYYRTQYKFGNTLGAGTYGIVREAEQNGEKYAIKIILKKNVKGNEKMVYDELEMLQRMKHPHIVRFHDWFESRVCNTYDGFREKFVANERV